MSSGQNISELPRRFQEKAVELSEKRNLTDEQCEFLSRFVSSVTCVAFDASESMDQEMKSQESELASLDTTGSFEGALSELKQFIWSSVS